MRFLPHRARLQLMFKLSEIVGKVLETLPPDPTYDEDMIHSNLLSGVPAKALQYSAQLDPWLAAHMADVMEALKLLEGEFDTRWVASLMKALHADVAQHGSLAEGFLCPRVRRISTLRPDALAPVRGVHVLLLRTG